MKKRICDHAVTVLERTGNSAVMAGDQVLLHQIAHEAGIKGPRAEYRVLSALNKTPGRLAKKHSSTVGGRSILVYRLDE